MKCSKYVPMMTVTLVGAALAWPGVSAQAAISPIVAGETIVFSDEFVDNSSGWSNIGAVSGEATVGIDPGAGSESVWHPTVAGASETISQITLPTTLDVSSGAIAIYMRVRVDNTTGGHSSKFGVEFVEQSPDNGFVNQRVLPGLSVSQLRYRNGSDGISTANVAPASLPDAQTFGDFRMLLTDNGDGSATLEGFRYDTGTAGYVSLGSRSDVDLDSGLFDRLKVVSTNADANGRAYFDSVVVAQVIPEPATLGLMGVGGLLVWVRGKTHCK